MNDVNELHEVLAGVVVADRELGDVLTEITGIARRAMPSVAAASVTLIRGEKPSTAAYDGQMALDADELQYERGYGPCMDAGLAGQMFLIDDMRSEQRWSDYAQNVAAHGVLSSLSVREAPRRSRGAGSDRRGAQSKLGSLRRRRVRARHGYLLLAGAVVMSSSRVGCVSIEEGGQPTRHHAKDDHRKAVSSAGRWATDSPEAGLIGFEKALPLGFRPQVQG
jgi:hypothetical protein